MNMILDWLVTRILTKRLKDNTNEIFNSIRITALIDELSNCGIIDNNNINIRIKNDISNLLSKTR